MAAQPSGFYRPSAARKRLIKDQERAEEYKEWIAAKTAQLQQQKELATTQLVPTDETQQNGDLEMR